MIDPGIPAPVVVGVLAVVTAALGVVGGVVGKAQVDKWRHPGNGNGTNAVIERQEGAWQERVASMLERLADTIAAGNEAHAAELRSIGSTMHDTSTAMRACVDEVIAQRRDFADYTSKAKRTMQKVRDLHAVLIPAKPVRRRRHTT